jgi:hypothetical protein
MAEPVADRGGRGQTCGWALHAGPPLRVGQGETPENGGLRCHRDHGGQPRISVGSRPAARVWRPASFGVTQPGADEVVLRKPASGVVAMQLPGAEFSAACVLPEQAGAIINAAATTQHCLPLETVLQSGRRITEVLRLRPRDLDVA